MVDWEAAEANVEARELEDERQRIHDRVTFDRGGTHPLYPAIVAVALVGPWAIVGVYVVAGGTLEEGWWWRTPLVGTLYFLPSLLAYKRLHATSLLALNLMFGWTGLVWLACLVWAFIGEGFTGRRHKRFMEVEKPLRDARARKAAGNLDL